MLQMNFVVRSGSLVSTIKKSQKQKKVRFVWFLPYKPILGPKIDWKWFQNATNSILNLFYFWSSVPLDQEEFETKKWCKKSIENDLIMLGHSFTILFLMIKSFLWKRAQNKKWCNKPDFYRSFKLFFFNKHLELGWSRIENNCSFTE